MPILTVLMNTNRFPSRAVFRLLFLFLRKHKYICSFYNLSLKTESFHDANFAFTLAAPEDVMTFGVGSAKLTTKRSSEPGTPFTDTN